MYVKSQRNVDPQVTGSTPVGHPNSRSADGDGACPSVPDGDARRLPLGSRHDWTLTFKATGEGDDYLGRVVRWFYHCERCGVEL